MPVSCRSATGHDPCEPREICGSYDSIGQRCLTGPSFALAVGACAALLAGLSRSGFSGVSKKKRV